MSLQGKAERTRLAAGWAYCFIVWKIIDIEPVFVVVHGSIIGHWGEQKLLRSILLLARLGGSQGSKCRERIKQRWADSDIH